MYFVVLGLFFTAVTSVLPTRGTGILSSRTSPTIEISLPQWLPGTFGPSLPQIGPLTDRR